MNRPVQLVVLSLCFVAATAVGGWWGLVAVGGVSGYLMRARTHVGWTGAGAAASGWAVLLVWDAAQGPVGKLARLVGGSLAVPGVVLLAVTLVFAAVVGGLSASAAAALSARVR